MVVVKAQKNGGEKGNFLQNETVAASSGSEIGEKKGEKRVEPTYLRGTSGEMANDAALFCKRSQQDG